MKKKPRSYFSKTVSLLLIGSLLFTSCKQKSMSQAQSIPQENLDFCSHKSVTSLMVNSPNTFSEFFWEDLRERFTINGERWQQDPHVRKMVNEYIGKVSAHAAYILTKKLIMLRKNQGESAAGVVPPSCSKNPIVWQGANDALADFHKQPAGDQDPMLVATRCNASFTDTPIIFDPGLFQPIYNELDNLCRGKIHVNDFSTNASVVASYLDKARSSDLIKGRISYCSLMQAEDGSRQRAAAWETLEPWWVSGLSVAGGLATEAYYPGKGTIFATGVFVAMATFHLRRVLHTEARIQSLIKLDRIGLKDDCSKAALENQLLEMNEALLWDILGQAGGMALIKVLPGAGSIIAAMLRRGMGVVKNGIIYLPKLGTYIKLAPSKEILAAMDEVALRFPKGRALIQGLKQRLTSKQVLAARGADTYIPPDLENAAAKGIKLKLNLPIAGFNHKLESVIGKQSFDRARAAVHRTKSVKGLYSWIPDEALVLIRAVMDADETFLKVLTTRADATTKELLQRLLAGLKNMPVHLGPVYKALPAAQAQLYSVGMVVKEKLLVASTYSLVEITQVKTERVIHSRSGRLVDKFGDDVMGQVIYGDEVQFKVTRIVNENGVTRVYMDEIEPTP